jgi:16S rRNA (uracil1498-N3)-methyltransferase
MRTHRLFTPESLHVGTDVVLDKKAAHYLFRVLRLPENSELILFNGNGNDYRCMLSRSGRDCAHAQVLESAPGRPESPLRITLTQAISRGDRMDYSLQKATELGVAAIHLLFSERVEVKLGGGRLEKRLQHWRGVIRSASEQCGRATVPELRAPVALHQWLEIPGRRLVLEARADDTLGTTELGDSVDLAVGPEGGFSKAEIDSMKRSGVHPVRLGPRILRTETAGPAAIAVLQAIGGDFK